MKNQLNKSYKGFTIIEVMIVLAIAGLIMVVVFLAIPQLQRSQRNNARQAVMNRISTEINNYASNNNGAIPTMDATATGFNGTGGGFYVRYIANNGNSFDDPSTGQPMLFVTMGAPGAGGTLTGVVTASTTAYYRTGWTCNGELAVAGTARNFIVATELEGGAIYCLDNG